MLKTLFGIRSVYAYICSMTSFSYDIKGTGTITGTFWLEAISHSILNVWGGFLLVLFPSCEPEVKHNGLQKQMIVPCNINDEIIRKQILDIPTNPPSLRIGMLRGFSDLPIWGINRA
jgi:hypothetical protein